MKTTSATSGRLDQCLTFINSQLRPSGRPQQPPKLAITVSREAGAGAWELGPRLADILRQCAPDTSRPWAVFDRELVEEVLARHDLPAKLAEFMPEDKVSFVENAVQELLGLHPPALELVQKTAVTILRLAALGNVILIGRGANLITQRLKHVFHVRLVGSRAARLERLVAHRGWDQDTAAEWMDKTDRGRERYVKEYFDADVTDPLLYDLVINTDRISPTQAAELVAVAALERVGWRRATERRS